MNVRPDMQYPNDTQEQWQMSLSQSVGDQGSTAGNNVIRFRMAQCCCRKMPGGLQMPIWKRQEIPYFLWPGEKTQSHRKSVREIITESYGTRVCNDNQIDSCKHSGWKDFSLCESLLLSLMEKQLPVAQCGTKTNTKQWTCSFLLAKELQQGGHRFLWLDKRHWPVSWPGLHILLDKKCLLYSQVSKS